MAKLRLESSADRAQLERESCSGYESDTDRPLIVSVAIAPSVSALDPGIVDEIAQLTPFESVGAWSNDLRLLVDFTFMDLYTYLVESKDKSFDKESLKSFKSLKGYRHFSDGFVQNVWVHELGSSKLSLSPLPLLCIFDSQDNVHCVCVYESQWHCLFSKMPMQSRTWPGM